MGRASKARRHRPRRVQVKRPRRYTKKVVIALEFSGVCNQIPRPGSLIAVAWSCVGGDGATVEKYFSSAVLDRNPHTSHVLVHSQQEWGVWSLPTQNTKWASLVLLGGIKSLNLVRRGYFEYLRRSTPASQQTT
jgi:hypothetical protein